MFLTYLHAVLWSIGFGSVAMLSILIRYILSRRRLQKLNVGYGLQPSTKESDGQTPEQRSIYDRWLMTRFVIAFVIMR